MEEANVLEIGQLGDRVACEIIRAWLRRAGRHLTNFQVLLEVTYTFSLVATETLVILLSPGSFYCFDLITFDWNLETQVLSLVSQNLLK